MRGEIGICLDRELDVGEDLVVIGPCWRREVKLFRVLRVKVCEEEGSQVDSTGAGNSLEGHNLRRA